jgi:hypothetical protein
LKINLYPMCELCDTAYCSGRTSSGKTQRFVGCWVCFATKGVGLCMSRDVEIVQDTRGVCNLRGNESGGVGGKKGYNNLSLCDFLLQLVRYDNINSYPAHCCLIDTKGPAFILHNHQPPHEWEASRWDEVIPVRNVYDAGHCIW